MEKSVEFILGDKLPWVYEAVIAFYGYSPGASPKEGRESKAKKKVVNAYVTSLMRTWVKAFGLENVAPHKTVPKKIRAGLESRFNSVLCKDVLLFLKEIDYGSGGISKSELCIRHTKKHIRSKQF